MRTRTQKVLELLSLIITMVAEEELDPDGSAGSLLVAPIPAQPAPERRNTAEVRGRSPRHSGTSKRVYELDLTRDGRL